MQKGILCGGGYTNHWRKPRVQAVTESVATAGMLAIQVPQHTQLLLTTLPGKGLSGLGWVLIFGVVSKEEMWMWSACKARRLRVPDRNGGWALNFCFSSNCACTELQPAFPLPWKLGNQLRLTTRRTTCLFLPLSGSLLLSGQTGTFSHSVAISNSRLQSELSPE